LPSGAPGGLVARRVGEQLRRQVSVPSAIPALRHAPVVEGAVWGGAGGA
jgi:hypothetical protein